MSKKKQSSKKKNIKFSKLLRNYILINFTLIVVVGFLLYSYYSLPDSKLFEEEFYYKKVVRDPTVAGTFYPLTEFALNQKLDELFSKTNVNNLVITNKQSTANDQTTKGLSTTNPVALIVPHAGYKYSGQVAANGYNQIKNPEKIKRVFILADNHNGDSLFNGVSIPNYTHYKTSLGEVKVSTLSRELIRDLDFASYVKGAHKKHIIEVQLPFLQKKLSDFTIIPIVFGSVTEQQMVKVAEVLKANLNENSLLIVSSDLSHYHSYEEANLIDANCIKHIEALDIGNTKSCEACGLDSILTLLTIANENSWQGEIIDYKNSGDTVGSKEGVVGYSSIVFSNTDSSTLSLQEKQILVQIAKDSVNEFVRSGEIYEPVKGLLSSHPALLQKKAAFVTLKINDSLRGCIGHLEAIEPLYLSVRNNAISAASKDKRFIPVGEDEISELDFSISVLETPILQDLNGEEFINLLEVGNHGVILKKGFKRSTFLPVVWEQFPDKTDFLEALCQKGGMDTNCWQDQSTKKYVYDSIKFDESIFDK